MQHPSHVPLSQLTDDAANARRTGRGAEPIYVASIRAKGVVVPLIVRPNGKGFMVTDGGKRLAALHWMRDHGEAAKGLPVDDAYAVPVTVNEDDDQAARDTSLTTAIVRTPLHPVDRFEAFAELQASGMSSADIAAHYGLADKELRQSLALGQLSPKIRAAWRAGEIGAREAQVFTLQPDHDEQAKLYARLKKKGQVSDWVIRREIGAGDHEIAAFLKFVGDEAYLKAGGTIVEDLFGDSHIVSDAALLRKLVGEKLQAKVDSLIKSGWSWAALAQDMPNRWSLDNIHKKKSDYTDADKSRSGCIVELGHQGDLRIDYGVLKPAESRKAKTAALKNARKEKGLPEDSMPKALAHRLSIALTCAAADAVAEEPSIALAAFIATFGEGVYAYSTPVKLRNEARVYNRQVSPAESGDEEKPDDVEDVESEADFRRDSAFVSLFEAALKLSLKEQLARVAAIVGRAFDFQTFNGGSMLHEDSAVSIICDALDSGRLKRALAERFDAKDYFGGINGEMRVKAAAEVVNADEAGKVRKMKKSESVAWCIANIVPTGWLPPELRTAHYDGPGAAVPAAEEKKPARRKKAA
jgi:ParB family chromosome partitioning protein